MGSGARTPMQGGLPPAGAVPGPVVEIACDESGFSGTNLLDPSTPVIAHASVDLSVAEAVALIDEFRFSPHEVKSGRFLRRPRAGEALEWLLGALAGRAHVHLVDKQLFLVTQVVELLAEPSPTRPEPRALCEAGRAAGADWTAFLESFAALVRRKRRVPPQQAVQRFLQAREVLLRRGVDVVDRLDPARVREVATRLDGSVFAPLEPLLPALAGTVLAWSAGRRQVLVTHDEQSALTAGRLTRLQRALAELGTLPHGVSPLAGLVMADSRDDPRVQVADLLAGAARRSRLGVTVER